jgi:hypothetical protein
MGIDIPLPEPLTPANCDLRDFQFMPLDVKRLLTSETWVLGTGDERAAAMTLWLESWHQVPAGSLPADARMLDHLSQSKVWKKVKEHALRGWVHCDDGRLYHPVVAEKVLEAWVEKLLNSYAGTSGNAKRWGVEVDASSVIDQILRAVVLLSNIAPQSKTLRKKSVVTVVNGSPLDKKHIAPPPEKSSPPDQSLLSEKSLFSGEFKNDASHQSDAPKSGASESDQINQTNLANTGVDAIAPRSPSDRKGQGQGQGQGLVNLKPIGAAAVNAEPAKKPSGDYTPKDAGQWVRYLGEQHGVELSASSVHDRKKAWPLFAAWVKAGVTTGQMDAAIARAQADATEPIAFLPAYADRVLASMNAARDSPPSAAERDQSRKRAYEVLTGKMSHEFADDNIIDV